METSGLIWPNFKLIQALMYVIITYKYEKDPIKNNREKRGNTVFQIITLSVAMETSGRIWPNFKLIQSLMYVIITCNYEKGSHQEQPRKRGNTVFQIITLSVAMETSGRIWPNFEQIQVLCISSLPASMKRIR